MGYVGHLPQHLSLVPVVHAFIHACIRSTELPIEIKFLNVDNSMMTRVRIVLLIIVVYF